MLHFATHTKTYILLLVLLLLDLFSYQFLLRAVTKTKRAAQGRMQCDNLSIKQGRPSQTAMTDQQDDYGEFGRSIAGAVLEGGKSISWALEMVRPLGCGKGDLQDWLKRYRRERKEALRWQKQKHEARQAKIRALREKAEELLKNAGKQPGG